MEERGGTLLYNHSKFIKHHPRVCVWSFVWLSEKIFRGTLRDGPAWCAALFPFTLWWTRADAARTVPANPAQWTFITWPAARRLAAPVPRVRSRSYGKATTAQASWQKSILYALLGEKKVNDYNYNNSRLKKYSNRLLDYLKRKVIDWPLLEKLTVTCRYFSEYFKCLKATNVFFFFLLV